MRQNILGAIGEITSLPGCSQLAVSHSVFIPSFERGAGIGTKANRERKRIVFDDLGYDAMICTVDAANAAQRHVLEANNWRKIGDFDSRKTGHTVEIWMCQR